MTRYFRCPSRLASVLSLGITAGCSAGLMFAGGCSELKASTAEMASNFKVKTKPVDLVAAGKATPKSASGPGLAVSLPTVVEDNGDLIVAGTVTRSADNAGPIPGLLELRIIAPGGRIVDQSLVHWTPEQIPLTGSRSASYEARMLGVPPAGSTVMVAYAEKLKHG